MSPLLCLCLLIASPFPCIGGGFIETFADDPVAAGRFVLHDDPGDGWRFVHDDNTQMLLAHYDTGLPTARLVRPLGTTLTHQDSFTYRVVFTINSDGFFADDTHIAQIAFGLMNTVTTGYDRVYGPPPPGSGAFDLVSFDYFPNITSFGGPSLIPTIINTESALGFAGSINFEWGPETAADPGDDAVPLDSTLTARVAYDARRGEAILRLLQGDVPLAINAVGKSFLPGGEDDDPTTIVTTRAGVGFAVDAFGILLWRDFSAETSTVIADVVFDAIEVCWPSFGDFDGDCDVDGDDLAVFEACASGPAVPLLTGCQIADHDEDNDVDQADFGAFQVMLTGPR